MARDASTYRGARRNACIRELHAVWGPEWYYAEHRNTPRWAIAQGLHTRNNAPIYVPVQKQENKRGSRIDAIYKATKRGDYAGAAKAFFGNKRTTRHATGLGGG